MEDLRVTPRGAKQDTVDANLEIWGRELPELDLETEGIIERIHRLERFVDRAMLSSGAMTNRLDNMESRGLIRRLDDPDDRRGVIIELTSEGKELWDATVAAQAEKESLVDSVLGEREKRRLNELLRRLMHAFEDVHGPVHPPHD